MTMVKQKSKISKTKNTMQARGITLIALVITIVILIILSTITISALTGENGLITQTKLAKAQTEIADAKEMAQTDIADWKISRIINNEDTTINDSVIQEILNGKDYVKEAKSTSFITKAGEHEIFYSELNTGTSNGDSTEDDTEGGTSSGINIGQIISGEAQNNYTNKIEDLGIPLINKYPTTNEADVMARRVWDMQLYNNRIYIGSGDYDNNKGPVDVYYYDISSETFVKEGTLQDEQINRFVIIDGKLMIPGIDPKEDWNYGNYYVWQDGEWIEKRNIPGGIHCFDMIEYNGSIFVGLGVEGESAIQKSTDKGETFSSVGIYDEGGNIVTTVENRVYDLFELKGSLYGIYGGHVYKYDESKNIFQKISDSSIYYGYMPIRGYVPLKTKITYKDKFILVNGAIRYTEDVLNYKTVPFDKTTYVCDVLENNNELYFLCNTQTTNGYVTSIYKTSDCENFELVLYYNYSDYAYSFEYSNNTFYFGIGTDASYGEESANSGRILRIEL